jgi:hypothetical protein
MKLLAEINEQVSLISEANDAGKKSYFIEGIFLQGDIKNKNRRVYPSGILAKESVRYNSDYIQKNRAYGELGHPTGPNINLERVSHMITKLEQDGSNFIGRAKIMIETPYGAIVKALMDEGAQLGVSSRGMGTVKPNRQGINEVQDDFYLATAADVVADPSGPNCYVNAVVEERDWVFDDRFGWRTLDVVEQQHKHLQNNYRNLTENDKLRMFKSFIDSITK